MSLDLVSEVWDTLRNHIDNSTRSEAADDLVNLLVDLNYEPEEIKDSFRGDKQVTKALKYYIEQHEAEEDEDEEEDYDDNWDDE